MSSYEYVKAWRVRQKQRLVGLFGSKCQVCGYDRCINSFDFHHVDPDKKDFTISSMIHANWSVIFEEVKKCVMVCANCHREIHAGLVDCPSLIDLESDYDPKKTLVVHGQWVFDWDSLDFEKELNECGSIVNFTKKYDVGESAVHAQITKRNIDRTKLNKTYEYGVYKKKFEITKEDLEMLIWEEKLPYTKIGEMFGVSDNAIRKRAKKLGIELRKR